MGTTTHCLHMLLRGCQGFVANLSRASKANTSRSPIKTAAAPRDDESDMDRAIKAAQVGRIF